MPPHGDETLIVAVGMGTAVGLSAAETAASVRAGTKRFAESRLHDRHAEPFVLATLPDDGLPPLTGSLSGVRMTARERRLVQLAAAPLRSCLDALPTGAAPPPLLLSLPDRATSRPIDPVAFLSLLARQVDNGVDLARSEAHCLGRVGGLLAVKRAMEWIHADAAPFVIVGGVDTYLDPYVLATLDAEQRVKSDANLDGFIPGEGAGFLLISSRRRAQAANLEPLASLSDVSLAQEPGHLYSDQPYRGAGLADAVTVLINGSAAEPIRDVYSSMNGEVHWAKEWGVAVIRNRAAFADTHVVHHPAECFGDLGAACGPVLVGLAALGIRDGYRSPPCLVYASSDREPRAALFVRGGRNSVGG